MFEWWTDDIKRKIIADYRRTHIARCPHDRAILTVHDVQTGKEPDDDTPHNLFIRCPTCHQRFFSDLVPGIDHD